MTVVLNTTIRPEVLRGRGAVSNAVGRYEKQTRVLLDDGWARSAGLPSVSEASAGATMKKAPPDTAWDGWTPEDDAPPPVTTAGYFRVSADPMWPSIHSM